MLCHRGGWRKNHFGRVKNHLSSFKHYLSNFGSFFWHFWFIIRFLFNIFGTFLGFSSFMPGIYLCSVKIQINANLNTKTFAIILHTLTFFNFFCNHSRVNLDKIFNFNHFMSSIVSYILTTFGKYFHMMQSYF